MPRYAPRQQMLKQRWIGDLEGAVEDHVGAIDVTLEPSVGIAAANVGALYCVGACVKQRGTAVAEVAGVTTESIGDAFSKTVHISLRK